MARIIPKPKNLRSTSHRTPWSYRSGTTLLYICPAGLKLILLLLFSASPFLGPHFAAGAALLIVCGAISAGLKLPELLSGSFPLLIMLLFFTAFRAFTISFGENNPVQLDKTALLSGLYLSARILLCFSAASLFFAVTTITEIRETLAKAELFIFRKRGRLSLALALMLGFLPRFFENWENALLAAKARCCKSGFKQVLLILPLVTERMIETAAETAEAMESRGLLL